jgi:hypothetical protein
MTYDEGVTAADANRVVLPLGRLVAHLPDQVGAHYPGPVPPLTLVRAWLRAGRAGWELRFHGIALDTAAGGPR